MNEPFDNKHGLRIASGVPALTGVVLPLKAARTVSVCEAKLLRYRLKPGLHALK